MIDQLKDLKDIYDSAKRQLELNRQPLEDLIKLNTFMKAIVDDPTLLLEKVDKDYRKFFFEEMSVGALKRLVRERSNDEKVSFTFSSLFISSLSQNMNTYLL
jgi:hypothetical protein